MLGPKVYFGPKTEARTLNWSLTLTSTVPEQELRSYVCFSRGNFFLKDVEGVICCGMNIFLRGGVAIFEFVFIF